MKKIRYAVVGLGYIAQAAVLPAFKHASNSELTALVSGEDAKLDEIARKYGVEHTYSYHDYPACLESGLIDAVFIALPNSLHRDFSVRASEAGIHVLCEKPMAVTEAECREMIEAAEKSGTRLMIAYRLHFEKANLRAAEVAQSGTLGDVRIFESVFALSVAPENIRLQADLGGGTLYDLGIYAINAARYVFRDEPIEVTAVTAARPDDARFSEVDEMTGAILKFPGERLALFLSSFGVSKVSSYRILGTEGELRVEPAYEYAGALEHHLTAEDHSGSITFKKRDQFAPEIIHFSDCILEGRAPRPDGLEGLADVRIIEALYRSAREGRTVSLEPTPQNKRPSMEQEMHAPPVKEPKLFNAASPSGK